MPITLGLRDLLAYDERHRVLICQECKYAIQKSALASHLLRHKIYRGERKDLLSSIAQLHILEPEDVQVPPPGSPPIDGLPIVSGFSCTARGCKRLYASFKRVKRHWSESHGMSDLSVSYARSVNLQKFFRGTKLRYFEVTSSSTIDDGPLIISDQGPAEHDGLNLVVKPAPCAQMSIFPPDPLCELDLETLKYFHHFTTTTSLTLPAKNYEPKKRWQVDIVAQALRLRWLMCGLLAISASHLAALSDDKTTKQVHWKRSVRFSQGFVAGRRDVNHVSGMAQVEEAEISAQMICIQRCYDWVSDAQMLGQRAIMESVPFKLQLFMMTIQGCTDPSVALGSSVSNDDMPEGRPDRVRSYSRGSSDIEISCNAAPELQESIRTLPYRMAEALGRPDSLMDLPATLSAIDALVDCWSLSYTTNDIEAVWMSMESWLPRLSDHFNQMIRRSDFAALIVLAHWTLSVKRAEYHCWFLRGLATKVVRLIVEELPADRTILSLVEHLID